MVLSEASNKGIKNPERVGDSLLASAFKCKYQVANKHMV
jgi:hypothetical protein